MDLPRAEAERDQVESEFTPMLRPLFERVPELLSVVFVDGEGECIDYVSAIDPFEAKVAGAHMHMLMSLVRQMRANTIGEAFALELATTDREVWVRCIGDGYVLVAMMRPQFDRAELREALVGAGAAFRDEVAISTPSWETLHQRLSVRVRPAVGWQYAPATYSVRGVRMPISDVLGRWTEPMEDATRGERVCFRVRTQEGQELTLVHEPDSKAWRVRE